MSPLDDEKKEMAENNGTNQKDKPEKPEIDPRIGSMPRVKEPDEKVTEKDIPSVPEDLPPPYTPEQSEDKRNLGPVFLFSDLHLGTNMKLRLNNGYYIDKTFSNDFKEEDGDRFLVWLEWVKNTAAAIAPQLPYDIVGVGDILDLWQADMPGDMDNYFFRINSIINTNHKFFDGLIQFLVSNPFARFHYVIGNHDDPFYRGNNDDDPLFGGANNNETTIRNYFQGAILLQAMQNIQNLQTPMPNIPSAASYVADILRANFIMTKSFIREEFRLYAEHGHKNDSHNKRGDNFTGNYKPCPGQNIVEQAFNPLEEFTLRDGSQPFQFIDGAPISEVLRFFRCIEGLGTQSGVRQQIEKFRDTMAGHLGMLTWAASEILPEDLVDYIADRAHSPENIRESYQEYIEDREFMVSEGGNHQIVILGHTHLFDWQETTNEIYANTDTWSRKAEFRSKGSGAQRVCQLVPEEGRRHPFVMAYWKPVDSHEGVSNIRGKVKVHYYYFTPQLYETESGEVNIIN